MRRAISSRSSQRGFSMVVIMIAIAVGGMLLLTFFKVFPMWYENARVQNALEGTAADNAIDARSKKEIWDALQKRFYVGDVRTVKREHVKISRKDGKTTVLVQYRTEDTFFANFFIGANFENQIVIDR